MGDGSIAKKKIVDKIKIKKLFGNVKATGPCPIPSEEALNSDCNRKKKKRMC